MNRYLSFLFIVLAASSSSLFGQNAARTRTFDALNYEIRTSFDKRQKSIAGETVVTFKPLADGFRMLELDAVGLAFDSVALANGNQPLKYKASAEKVAIELDRAYGASETVAVRLVYKARPKNGVRFVGPESRDGKLLHDAQIWTQGQAEYSRYWFPSYDYPDDKATTEQYLTVDGDETAIANGALVEQKSNADGTKTFHYRMDVPHSVYLTSFVIGKYAVKTDFYGSVPLRYFVYPSRTDLFDQPFGRTKAMMEIYEALTGVKFQFNKYDQTIVAKFTLGGMENVTATTLADSEIFFVEYNQLMVEDLVAHELAHSWFGNLVTCRSWGELWLNEGFATFMEAAYRERAYGRSEYLRKLREDAEVYFAGESRMTRPHPLRNTGAPGDDSIFDAINYQKGGGVVHMLRETVGDRDFWKGVNLYLERHKFANVESADLKKAMEDASGKNLDRFFAQWVYGAGYPRLVVRTRFDEKAGLVYVTVAQTQKPDPDVELAYSFPLDIELSAGSQVASQTLDVTKREETFTIKFPVAPASVVVDKEYRIPLKTVKVGRN